MPLDITSIAVDQSGQLTSIAPREFSFRFRYRGISFAARCKGEGDNASARLTATLGVLPFSAESAVQRRFLGEILHSAEQHLGPILFLSRGRIQLSAELPMPNPVTAVGLVTELTRFLLPLSPYFELMAMVRMINDPPPSAAR